MLHRIKGPGVEAIRERVVHEPVRGDGKLPIVAIFESQAREGSEIVGIAHSAPLLLKYLPISHGGAVAMGSFKTFAEVRLDPVVVEQRIVDVEQKDGVDPSAHGDVSCWRLREAATVDDELPPDAREQ